MGDPPCMLLGGAGGSPIPSPGGGSGAAPNLAAVAAAASATEDGGSPTGAVDDEGAGVVGSDRVFLSTCHAAALSRAGRIRRGRRAG